MTDIVERLRWSISADTPARYPDIVTDAIIEIERLRAALELVRDAVEWNNPQTNSVLIRVKMALEK